MSTPKFPYRNTMTGLIGEYTEEQASIFPTTLERVADDTKPFAPGLFRPGLVGEFPAPERGDDTQDDTGETPDSSADAPSADVLAEALKSSRATRQNSAPDSKVEGQKS